MTTQPCWAILVTAILLGTLVGCKSFQSSPSSSNRWLTPKPKKVSSAAETSEAAVRGQAPGAFSSPDVYSTTETMPAVAAQPAVISDPWASVTNAPAQPVGASPAYGAQVVPPHHSAEQPIPPQPILPGTGYASPLPSVSADPWDDPWGFGGPDTGTRKSVSIESQAKKEEEAQERARLAEMAASKPKDGTPKYLQPLEKWNGPFENREKKQNIEQDIIRRVGYVETTPQTFDNAPVFDWEKEEQKGFDWEVLDPVNFFTKVRDWLGMGPDEKKANAAMKKGREILLETPDLKDKKKCNEAAKLFMDAAKRWPDSVLEEDALHLAGECYFFAEEYSHALKAYQKLMIKYQHSKHTDNAGRRLFVIARYWENEDRRGVAFMNMTEKSRPTFDTFGYCHKAYETIFINDPNGPISDDAVMALASAYLAKGRYQGDSCYDKAAYYYNYLRENYPLSKHIAKAHEYELVARTNAYMGAEYNGKTLDEAGKLAETTLRQFSTELDREEKDEVLALKENVVLRQAEREWTLGQYYDHKKYYGSARLFYEKILDRYPQTEFAEKAQTRLELIRDKPDQPDQLEFIKKLYMPRGTY